MKKQLVIMIITILLTLSFLIFTSYAFYQPIINTQEITSIITTKTIGLDIDYTGNIASIFNNISPKSDEDGMLQDGFLFTVLNNGDDPVYYTIALQDLGVNQNQLKINAVDLKINLSLKDNPDIYHTYYLAELKDGILLKDVINPTESKEYVLKAWIDEACDNDSINAFFKANLVVDSFNEPDSYRIINSFNNNDLKQVIRCNQDYTNCSIYNTISSAINDTNNSLIILTNDILITSTDAIEIPIDKNIIIDLNGHKILKTNSGSVFQIRTNTNVKFIDSMRTGMLVNAYTENCGHGIVSRGDVIIEGGTYIVKNSCAVLYTGASTTFTGTSLIKAGSFKGNNHLFQLYSSETNPIIIEDGFFIANNRVFNDASSVTGTLQLKGGIFVSNSNNVIYSSKMNIAIIQTTNPIYMLSKAKVGNGSAVIYNNGNGNINVSASMANQCDKEPLNTTSGLCIYAEGDKVYKNGTSNTAVYNKASGVITIDGGTYFGGCYGFYNYRNGPINIKNAKIGSFYCSIANNSSSEGDINICSSNLSHQGGYDLAKVGIGSMYYYNVTFSNGTTTPSSSNIRNWNQEAGSISAIDSCPF